MIIKSCALDTVIGVQSKLPVHELPEYAFLGRSNVGKSALINAVLNRKSLARTSAEPGKTKTINYYLVNDAFYLVDLPGYGYAKASLELREKWGRMIERYLLNSAALKRIFILIDMRHAPGKNDLQMVEWVRAHGFSPVIVMTKADKLSKNERQKMQREIRESLSLSKEALLIETSSVTKEGIEEIRTLLSWDA